MSRNEPIGIVSTGMYIPQTYMSSTEIAHASGLPTTVVEEKMGIRRKPIPGKDDHTCAMGVKAARKALDKANLNPKKIDLIIYIGEEHKEYPIWTAGIKLQQEIGAVNAWAFDVALRCGTTIMALKTAKAMMLADEAISTVLLAGGYRNVDLIDYENPRTRFMYNLSAGGGAILLQKGWPQNRLLESHLITDGSFSEDVYVPGGGTKQPLSAEVLSQRLHYLDVADPEGMKERLDRLSMRHFVNVIRRSVEKSGYGVSDIGYLGMLHMKPSAHRYVLHELGLSEKQTVYLQDFGHMGQIDQILSLEMGLDEGKIRQGDVVVFVSAGIGYSWGATTLRWG